MTDQERQQAYLKALEALSQQYGLSVAAQLAPRQVGPQLQVEAQLVVVAIEGWTPPAEPQESQFKLWETLTVPMLGNDNAI